MPRTKNRPTAPTKRQKLNNARLKRLMIPKAGSQAKEIAAIIMAMRAA